MLEKFGKYKQFKIYMKLMKESYDVLNKDETEKETDNVLAKSEEDDKDIPGVIKTRNPQIRSIYDKLMKKYEPSELIFDNKEN